MDRSESSIPPRPPAGQPSAEDCGPFPDWVHRLGGAVWINDPQQKLCFLNQRAEQILGLDREKCLGRPCYQVTGGRDGELQPFCEKECALLASTRGDGPLESRRIAVRDDRGEIQWLQLMVIPIEGPDGSWPWLVHCAEPVNRTHRMEHYLEQVARRNGHVSALGTCARWRKLTPRQTEVLDLLAQALGLDETAARLGIRRVTVRNHVQHILPKLGVHSIQEAVAIYLVEHLDPRP